MQHFNLPERIERASQLPSTITALWQALREADTPKKAKLVEARAAGIVEAAKRLGAAWEDIAAAGEVVVEAGAAYGGHVPELKGNRFTRDRRVTATPNERQQRKRYRDLHNVAPEIRNAYYEECRADKKLKKLPCVGGALEFYKSWLKEKETNEIFEPVLPDGIYDLIVIDPPWPYGTKYNPEGRRVANPYPEMSIEEIRNQLHPESGASLSIPCADDCVLWLWTTHKFLPQSFEILNHWGFDYKITLTWVKDRMGIGQWLRSQSEFCLLSIRGNPGWNLTNQTTVLHAPLRQHSRKPEEFYDMLSELCPAQSRLDIFGRQSRPGWHILGNQADKFQ